MSSITVPAGVFHPAAGLHSAAGRIRFQKKLCYLSRSPVKFGKSPTDIGDPFSFIIPCLL
jgi:hypothetical protein